MVKYLILIAAVGSLLGGCYLTGSDGCLCTMEYVGVGFTLVDGSGQPIPDVPITVTMARTGKLLKLAQEGSRAGYYLVITDSQKELVDPSGELICVTGSVGAHSFEIHFVVGVSDECHCHIRKVSGPTQVVVG